MPFLGTSYGLCSSCGGGADVKERGDVIYIHRGLISAMCQTRREGFPERSDIGTGRLTRTSRGNIDRSWSRTELSV